MNRIDIKLEAEAAEFIVLTHLFHNRTAAFSKVFLVVPNPAIDN